MTRARRAIGLALTLGLLFVVLEEVTGLRLGLAGVYVVGMAGGIWIGEVMTLESIGSEEGDARVDV